MLQDVMVAVTAVKNKRIHEKNAKSINKCHNSGTQSFSLGGRKM